MHLILQLSSTYSDTYGNQEETAFNTHYQTTGYHHPLVAFDGLTKDFLKAELRSGNTYCSTGAADFLNPLLEHYNQTVPVSTILVRADSGFAACLCFTCSNIFSPHIISNIKVLDFHKDH